MADGLRHAALEDTHRARGAKLVEFGGWLMPVAYPEGTLHEHRACRTSAVVFDVSHLGTVRVEGDAAFDHLQRALTNDLRKVAPGRAQYTHLLDEEGSDLDDIIVWWVAETTFDVMPNASNTDRVVGAIGGTDTTATRCILAVQGPEARARVAKVSEAAAAVKRFRVERVEVAGADCTVAGTGYTGEDGVEIAVPVDAAASVWDALMSAGVEPAGLGARDTLRLEAGLPLHGHELGAGITPLQAGLGWVVGWDKDDFTGKAALLAERDAGPARLLRGMVIDGRQPARDGSIVSSAEGERIGLVTSGNFSPMLEKAIALGFLEPHAQIGDPVTFDVRGRTLTGSIVKTPFVEKRL
ncbi:MAG TPA: glycine cleavage system aminomethyltransferase GcvT [Acidimicrobiales bacterium]|nr:glycine cleavage system aminomethyltransferase GcvT [Acidimicrobiales bacterium]